MIYYLWVFVLGGVALVSLFFFLLTLTRDANLVRSLKKKKTALLLNFSLFIIAIISSGLIVYLFLELKRQIDILG